MENSKNNKEKKESYQDLEKEKKKTGRIKDLPKSPNQGTVKKK